MSPTRSDRLIEADQLARRCPLPAADAGQAAAFIADQNITYPEYRRRFATYLDSHERSVQE
jgi:hypothetical protein